MKNLLVILVCLIIGASSCEKTNYEDNLPAFEITVLDETENVVPGAMVSLFLTQEDWENQKNPVITQSTNELGKATFNDLDEKVYYFFAEKNRATNALEVSYLELPLEINKMKTITTTIR